jgi:hypothetical protein
MSLAHWQRRPGPRHPAPHVTVRVVRQVTGRPRPPPARRRASKYRHCGKQPGRPSSCSGSRLRAQAVSEFNSEAEALRPLPSDRGKSASDSDSEPLAKPRDSESRHFSVTVSRLQQAAVAVSEYYVTVTVTVTVTSRHRRVLPGPGVATVTVTSASGSRQTRDFYLSFQVPLYAAATLTAKSEFIGDSRLSDSVHY